MRISPMRMHVAVLLFFLSGLGLRLASATELSGALTDPQGHVVPHATVRMLRRADASIRETRTDATGRFTFPDLNGGEYRITAESSGFAVLDRMLVVHPSGLQAEDLQFSSLAAQAESVNVTASITDRGVFEPDPAQQVMIRDETLDANPGRPGMPVSIPGMPVESPAGGVKPPQYFVPGVAGDHGEPIAMFFQVGGYLFPNNLPANAHGNGYADPNVIIPAAIETVQTDGGAFNVREGNNSVNAAITFGLRDRIEPFLRLTGDYRDLNLVGGWSPGNPSNRAWIGAEISLGNGYLARLEHRKQYKGNVSKVFTFGKHELTAPRRQFQFSGYYRYYTLDVRPNFGDGLIRQSEHRNANSENILYSDRLIHTFSLLAGADIRREAPRDLNLYHFDEAAGVFKPRTSNNLTINFYSPFAALDGAIFHVLHYDAGYRLDQVAVNNQDLISPRQSFDRSATIRSPKATLTFLPPENVSFLPVVSLSYGQAFHINDPRIGTTAITGGTIVAKARAYQVVVSKTFAKTEFRLNLAHVTTAQQLARVSNDTGLQQDLGPGVIKSLTFTLRHNFQHGFIQGLYSKADARDRLTGLPTPEAPRQIYDILATIDQLPFHLVARSEYEEVSRKPLGQLDDGSNADSVPVRELRAALIRPFQSKGFDVGVNVFIASGYGGQTLESIALPGEGAPFTRNTGFPLRSYVSASFTYYFRRR